ncbi:MAG: YiiG family protein [Bacteroidia bacterium]|nr:YiiG family protein [Bacteroidia bacterium]
MKYSTRNNLIFILVFALITGAYFLFKRQNSDGKKGETKDVVTVSTPDLVPDGALLKKLNTCIDCVNRNRDRARASYNRYGSWVKDMEKGPQGNETHKYGLYTIYGGKYYCDNLEGEKMLPPVLTDIDANIKTYLDAMRTLEALLIKTDKYYDNEDWKDDGMAKGKELHPQLIQAFNAFFNAETTLIQSVEKEGEKQPNSLPPVVVELTGSVFKIMENINNNPDAEALKNLIEATEAQAGGLSTLPDYNDNYKSIEDETGDLLKSAKKVMRNIKDGKPYTDDKRYFMNEMKDWINDYNQIKPEDGFLHKAEIQ